MRLLLASHPRPLLAFPSGVALMVGLGLVASASGGEGAAGVTTAVTATSQVPPGRMPSVARSPGALSRVAAPPRGVAAIRPIRSVSSRATPTHTELDVRAYLRDHPIPDQDPAGSPATVRRSSSCLAARWPRGCILGPISRTRRSSASLPGRGTFVGAGQRDRAVVPTPWVTRCSTLRPAISSWSRCKTSEQAIRVGPTA
jgi:hypothetical protein